MTATPSRPPAPASACLLRAALALALAGALGSAVAAPPQYHLTVLETPADASSVTVTDINDAGQIVGHYQNADFVRVAVLWDADGAHPLDVPAGIDIDGIATAINNAGQIVGTATDFSSGVAALLWDAADPGPYTVISSAVGEAATPNDINDAGVVAGGKGGFGTGAPSRAFVWTAEGGLVDYGLQDETMPDQQARWNALNNAGKLVGHWNVHSSSVHAVVGQVGVPQVSSMSAMTEQFASIATAVNDTGVAVGLGVGAEPVLVPILFAADGTYTEIPGATLDQPNGGAIAINAAGVIVGTAGIGTASGIVPGQRAWVHIDGVSYDLYQHVDDTGGFTRFSNAVAINAHGVIVGTGRLADDSVGSFMLTPIVTETIFADGFDAVD